MNGRWPTRSPKSRRWGATASASVAKVPVP